jgi:hypothetical protein
MKTLIFSIFLLLTITFQLSANESLSDEIPTPRFVPYAQFEAMKMNLEIYVCENETPEQAAKTIADAIKQFPGSLPKLQLLDTAPAHLVAQFESIKHRVDQLLHPRVIEPQKPAEVLVAETTATETAVAETTVAETKVVSRPRFVVKHQVIKIDVTRPEIVDIQLQVNETKKHETPLMAYYQTNGPSAPGGDDPQTFIHSFMSLPEIFVASMPESKHVETAVTPLKHETLNRTGVSAHIYDPHVRVQPEVETHGSILNISIPAFKGLAPKYAEILYMMALLTILASAFRRSVRYKENEAFAFSAP